MSDTSSDLKFDPQRAANAVPERHRLERPMTFGICKRCLANDLKTGDIVVRVYGQGWWHDDCYRVVNPRFYDGLPQPAAAQPAPF